MRIVQVTDRVQWDTTLASLPQPHVLQTWDWGDFKRRWGWQPTRLLFEESGRPLAAAQILQRRLAPSPFSVSYVSKGPALDYSDTHLLTQVLIALEQHARERRSIFVKIDPDVWLGTGIEPVAPLPEAAGVLKLLAERGWRYSSEQIQFKNTVVIDLAAEEKELLSRMKAKTRYNLRLTTRRGVNVRPGAEYELGMLYALYNETAQRDGFIIRPAAYYLDVWTQFLRNGRAHLLLAEVEGKPIAGLILFHFARTAWYMYGASSSQQRNSMPNHLLQWEAIRLAKQLGCSHYDMWGAPDRFDASDPMWGVYRFKAGFGGETLRGLGAFDYSPWPRLYWAYTVVMPRLLALMRQRHQRKIHDAVA